MKITLRFRCFAAAPKYFLQGKGVRRHESVNW